MGQPKSDNNQGSLKNIAIIMDGNGRWAKSNKLQITQGHEKGVGVVKDIVEECVTQNIDTLTVYAFSSENWARPKKEINGIKTLIIKAISDQVPELIDQRVKLNFFGDLEDFGSKIIDKISKAQKDTFLTSPSLELNVALGYGGRSDIIQTSKILAKKVQDKEINIKDINEDIFSQLSLVPVDNIDLVIRTGGDKRLSNFLLFQIAYAEIMFIEKLWPDFTKEDFIHCLESFKNVERRFGKRI
jgi:undecaprenyl diphosphate synthase|tara:strand:- start:1294 stop:2022 length:729 start_codon:yes stop_codon:yes gene_type:complete